MRARLLSSDSCSPATQSTNGGCDGDDDSNGGDSASGRGADDESHANRSNDSSMICSSSISMGSSAPDLATSDARE